MTNPNAGVRDGGIPSQASTNHYLLSINSNETNHEQDSQQGREAFIDSLLQTAIVENETFRKKMRLSRKIGTTQELQTWATLSTLPPVSAPISSLSPELQGGALSFSASLNEVLRSPSPLNQEPTKGSNHFSSMQSNQLLAAFLKLQIKDPNNSVETHNDLHQCLSKLRQVAIEEAQKLIERAEEKKKEAAAYASSVQSMNQVLSAFTIGLSLATGGASLLTSVAAAPAQTSAHVAAQAAQKSAIKAANTMAQQSSQKAIQTANLAADRAAQAALDASKTAVKEASKAGAKAAEQAAKQAVKEAQQGVQNLSERAFEQASKSFEKTAQLNSKALESARPATNAGRNLSKTMEVLVQGSTQLLNAKANAVAAKKAAAAQQMDLLAQRMRLFADLLQEQLQEEAEIINQIMESKNKTIDAVMKMLDQQHGVAVKMMASGLVR